MGGNNFSFMVISWFYWAMGSPHGCEGIGSAWLRSPYGGLLMLNRHLM